MKTEIFKTYLEFTKRADRGVNGVSPEFAEDNPDFAEDNNTNEGCWNCSDCSFCSSCSYCSDCSSCSSCSDCSSCSSCSYCSSCSSCSDCSSCSYCSSCSDCSDCSFCSSCSYCSDCSEKKQGEDADKPATPKIPDIHKKVFEATSAEGALEMDSWHTCETTHCRAGWVVHLAGKEGKALENFHDTCLAAQLIYRESGYEINPCRFFDKADAAMADMKRLAEGD